MDDIMAGWSKNRMNEREPTAGGGITFRVAVFKLEIIKSDTSIPTPYINPLMHTDT